MWIPELHAPGYNYLGPGTKSFRKKPKNLFDEIARRHDLEYAEIIADGNSVDAYVRFNHADQRFLTSMIQARQYFNSIQKEARHQANVHSGDMWVAKMAIKVFQAKKAINKAFLQTYDRPDAKEEFYVAGHLMRSGDPIFHVDGTDNFGHYEHEKFAHPDTDHDLPPNDPANLPPNAPAPVEPPKPENPHIVGLDPVWDVIYDWWNNTTYPVIPDPLVPSPIEPPPPELPGNTPPSTVGKKRKTHYASTVWYYSGTDPMATVQVVYHTPAVAVVYNGEDGFKSIKLS